MSKTNDADTTDEPLASEMTDDDPVFASDEQPDYVATARSDGDHDWELDPEEPWKTTDHEARLERAKEQARQKAVTSNYGTAGGSR